MKSTMKDVLRFKGHDVFWVEAHCTVDVAVSVMLERNVGSLLVRSGDCPVGLLAERDIVANLVHEGRSAQATLVNEVMTPNPAVVKLDAPVRQVMAAMTVHRCRHLPVVKGREVVGIVSIGDLSKWVTRDLEDHVSDLARYIHGQYVSDSAPPPVNTNADLQTTSAALRRRHTAHSGSV